MKTLTQRFPRLLTSVIAITALSIGGCAATFGAEKSIIVLNFHDLSSSTHRIQEFGSLLKKACFAESELFRSNDQSLKAWFSGQVQVAGTSTITSKVSIYQLCKNVVPPDELRQISPTQGTKLSIVLHAIPSLTQQQRSQMGQLTKAALAVIVMDADDGEATSDAAWKIRATEIAALSKNRIVTVLLAADSQVVNQASRINDKNFLVCPLTSPKECLDRGFNAARSL